MRSTLALTASIFFLVSLSCQSGGARQKDHSTIKLGYFGDLSGPTLNFGISGRNGVLMAVDEINQAGGIDGRPLDVVIEDDQGSPEKAAAQTAKLIDIDRAVAVIAGGTSSNSRAAAPKAQVSAIPMISPSSTDPAVTQIGDFIFRACFIDAFQGEVMARFASNTLKAHKAAILLDFNSSYSRGLADFFELSFTRLGGQVVSKQSYTQGDRDFRGQLNTVHTAGPDVIFVPGCYGDVALIARQARQLGFNQPLLGGDGWDAPELWDLAGDAVNGSYISSHYSIEDQSPIVQRFVLEYKQRYGNLAPDAHAALAYDATRLLADALQRAGSTEGPRLRDALAQTKDFIGVTGSISIDADRNAVKPAVVLKLQDGRFIYQETIHPETTPAPPSGSPVPNQTASPAR